jgi:hypothetical protein
MKKRRDWHVDPMKKECKFSGPVPCQSLPFPSEPTGKAGPPITKIYGAYLILIFFWQRFQEFVYLAAATATTVSILHVGGFLVQTLQ